MTTLLRVPTIEEVKAAISPGLHESYWWATGWNFNRPVIAECGIGATREGAYVWVRFFSDSHCPVAGYKASELANAPLKFVGPIPLPDALRR